jgi:hypothetical protein
MILSQQSLQKERVRLAIVSLESGHSFVSHLPPSSERSITPIRVENVGNSTLVSETRCCKPAFILGY